MDTNTLLILVVGLLTCNLLFVGVYIVLVLKEVRESVRKINIILDKFNQVSDSLTRPLVGVSGALLGAMKSLKFFRKLRARGEVSDV